MKFAYADPPYLGMGAKLYDRPEWDDIETHRQLIERLQSEYPDGWAMSLSSPTLRVILPICPEDCRVGAWTKTFAVFRPGINPAYAWEPVIFRGGRTKRSRTEDTVRDWVACPIAMRRGCPGAKPPDFAAWIVQLLGARVDLGDTITDLFHGSGAMLGVWRPDVNQMLAQAAAVRAVGEGE